MYDVTFFTDPVEFLARAGDHLAAMPVEATVVSTIAERIQRSGADPNAPYQWFATVTDPAGAVVGVGMRTAPFLPYPPYLLSMPHDAARALAEAALDQDGEVAGVNGSLAAAEAFAGRVAELTGGSVEVAMHTRLFELGTLVDPRPVPGRLRAVRADELEVALGWFHRFFDDADEQAGRPPGRGHAHEFGTELMERKLAEGVLWFWVDEYDEPVHLTGFNPPAYGTARIGPVYTPKEQRGRGYASAAVAAVSRMIHAAGDRPILFTDQANPTSNGIYIGLGYEQVIDTVELLIKA